MLLGNVNLQRENPPEATPPPAELQDLLNVLASAIAQRVQASIAPFHLQLAERVASASIKPCQPCPRLRHC